VLRAPPRPLLEGHSLLEVMGGLQRKLRGDFSLDQAAAARLLVGLGGSVHPALSIFGMPMPDMGMQSPQVRARGPPRWAGFVGMVCGEEVIAGPSSKASGHMQRCPPGMDAAVTCSGTGLGS
jgi:hypothetical protein